MRRHRTSPRVEAMESRLLLSDTPQLVVTTTDAIPPVVTASTFDYAAHPDRISFTFSKDVSGSLGAADLVIEPLTEPGAVIVVHSPTYDGLTNTGTFELSPDALPNGNYHARLIAPGILDAAGNVMLEDVTLDFFALSGDVNHDRVVDISDLAILATHWQQTGVTFGQGDVNSDGLVDISDLALLATNWQQSVPVAAAPQRKVARVAWLSSARPVPMSARKSLWALEEEPRPLI